MKTIKIVLVDDHAMVRKGLKAFLDADVFEVVGEASNGKEALDLLADVTIDVLVTDMMMPEMNGIDLCKEVSKLYPAINILALTMMNEPYNIKKMLGAGAKGYILKDCTEEEMQTAIQTVSTGSTYYSQEVTGIIMEGLTAQPTPKKRLVTEIPLTKRENEILHLICKEKSNQEIADELFISNRTVEAHKRNLLDKTGCKNIAGLVLFAVERKLFDDL
ncbi:response regulator transcription factor [Carboxylicivirga sp. M1479]|uniref:response regulator transcription factor n=1 Tax=Carboxylicivirga sp. M1479 TaxID=2594476 RepID=UPI001178267A|nr:response regulator transcription factor [Carboxylicivirga sp. M1479]TRX66169.1 response regulator transcription factor [Carboxylicivirga sp. M1479]